MQSLKHLRRVEIFVVNNGLLLKYSPLILCFLGEIEAKLCKYGPCNLRIIELLAAASLSGVSITIIIAETGYRESDLQTMGFNILHRPTCKMQCAVIDQRIGWYGSVNLIGRSLADTNVIRLETSEFANALVDALCID